MREINETPAPAKCVRCGRKLTAPASVAAGLGPTCQVKRAAEEREMLALEAGFTARQVEDARELLEDGGLAHLRGTLYLAVSTDGRQIHRLDLAAGACTCEHGIRRVRFGRPVLKSGALGIPGCYHLAAAFIAA